MLGLISWRLWRVSYLKNEFFSSVSSMTNLIHRKPHCRTVTMMAEMGNVEVSLNGSKDDLKICNQLDLGSAPTRSLISETSLSKASELVRPLGLADRFELDEQLEELEVMSSSKKSLSRNSSILDKDLPTTVNEVKLKRQLPF